MQIGIIFTNLKKGGQKVYMSVSITYRWRSMDLRRGYRRKYRKKNNSDIFTLYALWNNMKDDVLASIVS